MIAPMPGASKFNKELITGFEVFKETVSAVRTVRNNRSIPVKEKLELLIRSDKDSYDAYLLPVLSKLCNLSQISFVSDKQAGAVSFMVRTIEYFIPLSGNLDLAGEIENLQEDLDYNRGFLVTVMKKLENQSFVQNAPANVLELERKKKNDAEMKIKSLEERIKELKGL